MLLLYFFYTQNTSWWCQYFRNLFLKLFPIRNVTWTWTELPIETFVSVQAAFRKRRRITWIDMHQLTYIAAHHWRLQNLQARFSTFNGTIHIWGSKMSRNYCILLLWGSSYVIAVLGMVTFSLDTLSDSSPHRTCKATKTCKVFDIEDSTNHLHLKGHKHPVWPINVNLSFSLWFRIPFLACNPTHGKKIKTVKQNSRNLPSN